MSSRLVPDADTAGDSRRRGPTPRLWAPLPAQHHRTGKIEELLELHGASGALAFLVLLSEAAAAVGVLGRDARGMAEMSWRDFAKYSGTPLHAARALLEALASEPFTLVAIESENTFGFRVRLLRWAEWDQMPKDPRAAERQQRARAKKKAAESVPGEFDPTTGRVTQP